MRRAPAYLGWRLIEPDDPFTCDIPDCEHGSERMVLTRYAGEDHDRRTALCRHHALPTIAMLEEMKS